MEFNLILLFEGLNIFTHYMLDFHNLAETYPKRRSFLCWIIYWKSPHSFSQS